MSRSRAKKQIHGASLREKLEAVWPSLSQFMEDSDGEKKQVPVRKHG